MLPCNELALRCMELGFSINQGKRYRLEVAFTIIQRKIYKAVFKSAILFMNTLVCFQYYLQCRKKTVHFISKPEL